MLNLKNLLIALALGLVVGVLGGWYFTAKYKDATWTASIDKQKSEAATKLQAATERALTTERKNTELSTQLEKQNVESNQKLDATLADNRRLARELGGLRDPGNMGPSLSEAALMLELRDIVARKLQALGHDVITDGAKGETFFQSNPNELANYHGSSWLVAQAIVDALTIKV